MSSEIQKISNVLRQRFGSGEVVGLSPDEVEEVRVRQRVDELPDAYREFLSSMGRRAGGLLAGTDVFYPAILDMKDYLDDFPAVRNLLSSVDESLIFGMHQGYQVYVATDIGAADPAVVMYEEGEDEPVAQWSSFSQFLRSELGQLA